MLELLAVEAQLHQVPGLQVLQGAGLGHRPYGGRLPGHEIPEIGHPGPGGGLLVGVDVVPAEIRGEVHHTAAGEHTLRREVGAVSPHVLVVVKGRVPAIGPLVGIQHGGTAVVVCKKAHGLPSSSRHCMRKRDVWSVGSSEFMCSAAGGTIGMGPAKPDPEIAHSA